MNNNILYPTLLLDRVSESDHDMKCMRWIHFVLCIRPNMVAAPFWTFYKIFNDGKRREVVQPKLIITTLNPTVKYINFFLTFFSQTFWFPWFLPGGFVNLSHTSLPNYLLLLCRVIYTRTRAAGEVLSIKNSEDWRFWKETLQSPGQPEKKWWWFNYCVPSGKKIFYQCPK